MAKKLTYEFVKSQFEKDNYIPKFTEYVNAHTKLDYICLNGHSHSTTWQNWQKGRRCPHCLKNNISEVRKFFEKNNYILTSKEYINVHTKLDCICSNGHEYSVSYTNFRAGNRCTYCSGTFRKNIEYAKHSFTKVNYTLLEDVYINCSTKMKYECPLGHQHYTTFSSWSSGVRCPSCYGNIKYDIEFIETKFEILGCKLISKIYLGAKSKLEYICEKGHKGFTTWNHWRDGHGCSECVGLKRKNLEDLKVIFESGGYILKSTEYKGTHSNLHLLCPNNHDYYTTWANWNSNGARCSKCSNNVSNFEIEVRQFIIDQGIEVIENDRSTILNPKTNRYLELDILFSCKTKAIECNGVYWHNRPEAIEKDKIKNKKCKELGINLLTITDKEWYNDQEKQKLRIINFIGGQNG